MLFTISYLGEPISENLLIINFERSLTYIDWNVIFLIMGMMIFIAVIEDTGIFQWLAFFAYRVSGGRMWLLLPILMLITGVASAFLDNVTTIMLMAPVSILLANELKVNPFPFIMTEIMAANIGGSATLIGDPTQLIIGNEGKLGFNDFLINTAPLSILALVMSKRPAPEKPRELQLTYRCPAVVVMTNMSRSLGK